MTLNLSRSTIVNICIGAGAILIATWLDTRAKKRAFLPSPRKTLLPSLSEQDIAQLPYPPDSLPGGRSVETPYGNIRVYEWGPQTGRKVVLLHGISTPCISLGSVAMHLVKRGCRVMTFDLFGRGFSDAPVDIPHDIRLYTTQLLLALASSPISWTGPATFDLIGYSFGGGLAAAFARYFPDRIRSVVLVAPGGVVRKSHINWRSKFLYSVGYFPERLLEYLVELRIRPSSQPSRKGEERDSSAKEGSTAPSTANVAEAATSAEVQSSVRAKKDLEASENKEDNPNRFLVDVDPEAVFAWQLETHSGFVPAFMSCIRHGPIHDQHFDWKILGRHLTEKRNSSTDQGDFAMKMGRPRALLALGVSDGLVLKDEVSNDIKEVLGEDNVEVAIIDGGHDFPITRSKDLADAISKFWDSSNYLQLAEN